MALSGEETGSSESESDDSESYETDSTSDSEEYETESDEYETKTQSLNILVPYYETLTSTLHICRKIDKLNEQQLIRFLMNLIDILEQNNHHSLIQPIGKSITRSLICNMNISILKYACNKLQNIL
eukprot:397167_1